MSVLENYDVISDFGALSELPQPVQADDNGDANQDQNQTQNPSQNQTM